MTITELVAAKTTEGFNVSAKNLWRLVGEVNNVRKYDVPFERDGQFATAQVKVVDEGLPTEDASVIARLEVPPEPDTFTTRLDAFMRSMEVAPIFAISRVEVVDADAVATVAVYTESAGKVSRKLYVVRERAGAMAFREIV